jgi:hypothetical protein
MHIAIFSVKKFLYYLDIFTAMNLLQFCSNCSVAVIALIYCNATVNIYPPLKGGIYCSIAVSAMGEFTASNFRCSCSVAVDADCSKVDVEMFWCCQGHSARGITYLSSSIILLYIHNSKMGERGKGGGRPIALTSGAVFRA